MNAQLTDEEVQHLVDVGSIRKFIEDFVDVELPNDPTYFHALLSREDYAILRDGGEIAFFEDGYPEYTGTARLRGTGHHAGNRGFVIPQLELWEEEEAAGEALIQRVKRTEEEAK